MYRLHDFTKLQFCNRNVNTEYNGCGSRLGRIPQATINLSMGSEETLGLYSCVYSLGNDQPKYGATRKPKVYILVSIP